MKTTQEFHATGQILWLDNITRNLGTSVEEHSVSEKDPMACVASKSQVLEGGPIDNLNRDSNRDQRMEKTDDEAAAREEGEEDEERAEVVGSARRNSKAC